jgi:predicted flavoprotein YhiN
MPTSGDSPRGAELVREPSIVESSPADTWDVIVIGGGAAGLLAGARAAELGRRVLIVEKNRRPGVKILMSGGTRCNLTHDCDARGIIAAFGSAGNFLHSPLAALGPRELVELFQSEGLPTKVEPTGKIFPKSDRAADVLAALVQRAARSGAVLAADEPVLDVQQTSAGFAVRTPRRTLAAPRVIVASGGASYPRCGTTGDGYAWLSALGHTIRPPRPALVPLVTDEPWIKELTGLTIEDVHIGVLPPDANQGPRGQSGDGQSGDGQPGDGQSREDRRSQDRRSRGRRHSAELLARRGSMLFTHFGLSGPAVLDVSRAVTGLLSAEHPPPAVMLSVDFLPGAAAESLAAELQRRASQDGKRLAATLVAGSIAPQLPRRLIDALMHRAGVAADRRAAELSRAERAALLGALKRCPIRITGSRGLDKAEVTAGGVVLDEVDSRTMHSKRVRGLLLAGEILDLDGFIGGYNFQAAFSTGWLAGSHA